MAFKWTHLKTPYMESTLIIIALQVPDSALTRHHKHRHRHDLNCRQCPPGHYVSLKCNGSSPLGQTQCTVCPHNTYKAHNSYQTVCENCSNCGEGLYVWRECSPISDTVCNSCQTQRLGSRTQDYYRKCVWKTWWQSVCPLVIRQRLQSNHF